MSSWDAMRPESTSRCRRLPERRTPSLWPESTAESPRLLPRIRFGLMSVLTRLGAHADWYELEQAYVSGA